MVVKPVTGSLAWYILCGYLNAMKNKRNFLIRYLIFVFTLLTAKHGFSQNLDAAAINRLVNSKNFVFTAQTALPARGGVRQLTTPYDLKITPDTITSYLPFFGRAYTAPVGANSGGIDFTATRFLYKATKKKKGWNIVIEPKDARGIQKLFLSISSSGSAYLQVISTQREPISFNGYVSEGQLR